MLKKLKSLFRLDEGLEQLESDKRQLESDKKEFEEAKKAEEDRAWAPVSIDLSKVFCIERLYIGDRREVTLIGHRNKPEGKVKEWTLYISRECHIALCQRAADFNENIDFISGQ